MELAYGYRRQERLAESLDASVEAETHLQLLLRSNVGGSLLGLAEAIYFQGLVLWQAHRIKEAVDCFARGLQVITETPEPDFVDIGPIYVDMETKFIKASIAIGKTPQESLDEATELCGPLPPMMRIFNAWAAANNCRKHERAQELYDVLVDLLDRVIGDEFFRQKLYEIIDNNRGEWQYGDPPKRRRPSIESND